MKPKRILFVLAFSLVGLSIATAREFPEKTRPEWDQTKARKMVQDVIDAEAEGIAWDEIRWMTDVESAIKKSKKEQRPIFVYWYVKKGGPKTAPC